MDGELLRLSCGVAICGMILVRVKKPQTSPKATPDRYGTTRERSGHRESRVRTQLHVHHLILLKWQKPKAIIPTFRTIRSAFSGHFRLGAKRSRQAVGGAFNAEEFKNLLRGLGDFV